jgi:tyrosinase
MTPYTTNNFENYHGSVHVFVYGHMSVISCSVNDPTFWFHHCFIDYLWEKCRALQTTNKETDYPTDSGVPANHHYNDQLKPFQNKTCIDGLSNSYIPGIYSYADSPGTCTTDADCGSKFLWCNSGKCTAAVGLNGRMLTAWPNTACYISNCPTGKIPKNVVEEMLE